MLKPRGLAAPHPFGAAPGQALSQRALGSAYLTSSTVSLGLPPCQGYCVSAAEMGHKDEGTTVASVYKVKATVLSGLGVRCWLQLWAVGHRHRAEHLS